jgi:glucose/arabinose dehydrogenase
VNINIALSAMAMAILVAAAGTTVAQERDTVRVGEAAYGDWRDDAPGVRRLIRPEHMEAPGASRSSASRAGMGGRSKDVRPHVPDGFEVTLFAEGLSRPRIIKVAPNGDVFVAESDSGQIRVFRSDDGATEAADSSVFASGLRSPYGIAFYPPGPDPEHVYVAQVDSVIRFPYDRGDLEARGSPETVVDGLPSGGSHWTRDIAFSPDGRQMFVSIGSASNVASGMRELSPEELAGHEARYGLGAAWGEELERAVVLAFGPDGSGRRSYATGIRNCSGLAVQPETADLWCATNERDGLGDNLPPDYATRVGDGEFYGWPWYYIGGNQDPRHHGARPELAAQVAVPDVLFQPHSAPLGIAFYDGDAFPEDFHGDGFVALHGSWNRASRTGYKVVRILMENGKPTGEYEDFMTGFVLESGNVWGRPVGVAVARDGALLISEDGSGTIWRVAPS